MLYDKIFLFQGFKGRGDKKRRGLFNTFSAEMQQPRERVRAVAIGLAIEGGG